MLKNPPPEIALSLEKYVNKRGDGYAMEIDNKRGTEDVSRLIMLLKLSRIVNLRNFQPCRYSSNILKLRERGLFQDVFPAEDA